METMFHHLHCGGEREGGREGGCVWYVIMCVDSFTKVKGLQYRSTCTVHIVDES